MNLYFLDNDNEELLVKKNAGPGVDKVLEEALADLKERKPDFVSHYQRCWWDNSRRFWIDFGSHTEFYIYHEPYADEQDGCGKDYCELNI